MIVSEDKKTAFNLELDQYIEARKKPDNSGFSLFKRKKQNSIQNNFNPVENKEDNISLATRILDLFNNIFTRNKDEPIEVIEMPQEEKQKEQPQNEMIDDEIEEIESVEKKSFSLSSLFPFKAIANLFRKDEEIEEDYIEEIEEELVDESVKINKLLLYKPVIKEEIKTVFSMTSNIIKKMPEKDQLNLMRSDEYQLYLALMKRYEIKK